MTDSTDNNTAAAADLLRNAKEQVASQPAVTCDLDTKRLLHELQVHQVELMMQNDELLRAFAEISKREARLLHEIEERKTAEAKLAETEGVLKDIMENTLSGFWDWNLVKNTEYLSPTYKQMFGYEDHEMEISPEAWQKIIFPEDLPGVLELFDRHVKSHGREPFSNEIRFRHRDGSTVWVICAGRVLRWAEDGTPLRMVGCHIDITDRKRAERTLQEQSERHSVLIDSFPHPVMLIGKDRMIIASNKVAQDIGAVPGSYCWREFAKSACIPSAAKEYFEEHGTPPPGGTHCLICRADACLTEQNLKNDPEVENNGRVYDTYWSPLSDETYLHYAIDVTERSMAQKALLESEERFRTLAALAPAGIYLADTNGDYLYANPCWCEMAGIDQQDALGQGWVQGLHPEDRDVVFENWKQMVESEGTRGMEYRFQTPDKRITWVYALATPQLDNAGKIVRYIGINLDVTGLKRAEEEKHLLEQQFQQTQKLESLGVLAGGIAHDFNNILAIIMGYCHLTQIDYKTTGINIYEIEKAAERGAALCRQMLAYAGKTQITSGQFNMRTLVDEMVTMLKATIPRNVVIKSELLADIPSLYGDPSQIRQVVMNLIFNASEAIGTKQGEVTVSLTRSTLIATRPEKDYHGREIPPGSYICLEVTDDGSGIDEETRGRIFEPFYTTKFTGRGLGLSAVLGIIKAHNGGLQLESRLGHGTAFKIYLPVQTQVCVAEQTLQLPDQADSWKGSGTILLVDDEAALLLVLRHMLKKLGFTVIEAVNGKEALDVYQKNTAEITMVLTDMGMPVMNGYELFCELKKLDPQLPIIFSSGFGDYDIASSISSVAMAGMLKKPYKFDQLQEVLRAVVEGAKAG